MKVLYSIPSLESVYAGRFVYEGLKNAFTDLGHDFRPLTADEKLTSVLEGFKPDILVYSLNFYHLKFLDLDELQTHRDRGLVVFCQVRAWQPVTNVAEAGGLATGALKDHKKERSLVESGLAGDVFWHWFEQDEPLMEGFSEGTGRRYETIHQAADRVAYYPDFDQAFQCDLAYVGSYLRAKRQFLRTNVLPLRREYDLQIHGSDWTRTNRLLGHAQRVGQYFNITPLKRLRRLHLSLDDERKLYSSARICLNVHEEQVRRTGSEINERTFKILACGGFELCDNVKLLRRFFGENELVTAEGGSDWREKIDHYLRHGDERDEIARAGFRKVMSEHTYHHRAHQILELAARVRDARAHGTVDISSVESS